MNIKIIARVVFTTPEHSHNKLVVTDTAEGPRVKYEVYAPDGAVRNAFDGLIPAEFLLPGTLFALVEFWDGYTLIPHRPGTYDGIYGAHSMTHKATFAVAGQNLLVLTNTPVDNGPDVTFIGGAESFWKTAVELYPQFENVAERAREVNKVSALVNPHLYMQALECQLDIVTEILKVALAADPTMQNLVNTLQGLKRDNADTLADLLAELKGAKANLRIAELRAKIERFEREKAKVLANDAAPETPAELLTPEQVAARAAAAVIDGKIQTRLNKIANLEAKRDAI